MADKDIAINIKTTADTSGARAAKASIEQLIVARKPLENVRSQFMSAREAEVAEVNRLADAARKARQPMEALGKATDQTASVSRSLNSRMQNVGYQVADFAVQVEGGTSALRAFSQQGSQVLGAFGPWGAVAGAVLAVGAAIFSAKGNMAEAKEESEDLEKALDDLAETAAKAVTQFKLDQFGKSTAEFEARTSAIGRMNDSLKRQVELQKTLADLEIAKQDTKAASEIRRIEADPNLSDDEKFSQVAKIREGVEGRERLKRLNEIVKAELDAGIDRETAVKNLGSAETSVAGAERAGTESAQALAEKAAESARRAAAKKRAEELEKELPAAKRDYQAMVQMGAVSGRSSEEDQKELARLDRLRKSLAEEQKQVKGYLDQGSDESAAASLTEAQKIYADNQKQLEDARAELEKSKQALEDAELKLSDVTTVGKSERELLGVRRNAGASDSEVSRQTYEREKREAAAEEARKAAEKRDQQNDRSASAAAKKRTEEAGIGRAALNLVPKEATENFRRAVQRAADGLQNGDQGKEIEELAKLMDRLANAVQIKGTKTQVDLSNLNERIKRLEGK